MSIDGFVPDDVRAKMADTLRAVLNAVTLVTGVPNTGAANTASTAALAAANAADVALIADRPRLWRRAADLGMVAAHLASGTLAVPAKPWHVSSLHSNWDDFKKASRSAGENFGGMMLISPMGFPADETAPPSWNGRMRLRLRQAMPVIRRPEGATDLSLVGYAAACRRATVETIIKNRRWGYNNVWTSGLQDWNKVEDADPGLETMDITATVQFTFKVTPVG